MNHYLSLWHGEVLVKERVTMRAIVERHAEATGISVDVLKGRARDYPTARARHAAMAECHSLGLWSLSVIGRFFGGRDHTTVLHGVRAHAARLQAEQGRAA